MPKPDDFSVPKNMQADYAEVIRVTDDFCKTLLNDEYALVCRKIAAALCRKRPSPLAAGNLTHCIAAIIHAAGTVNFLWDKSQKPYMRAAEIAERFRIGNGSVCQKSKEIQRALKLVQLDPRFCLPSRLADNPLVWMIEVNGFIIDARRAPREIQEEVFRLGLIPYLPDDLPKRASEESPAAIKPTKNPAKSLSSSPMVDGPSLFSDGAE